MRCTIEPMKLADYDEVHCLWQSAEGVGLNESDSRSAIGLYLKRNRGMSFVAREGNKIIGAVLCGHDGRRGYLNHLAVAPSQRRKGLGTKLVDRCLGQLKKAGILKCNIFIYANNVLGERFWRSNGWNTREDLRLVQKNIGSPRVRSGC